MVHLLSRVFGDDAQTRLFRPVNGDSARGDGCRPGQTGSVALSALSCFPFALASSHGGVPGNARGPENLAGLTSII